MLRNGLDVRSQIPESKPLTAVWVDNTAVGTTAASTPIAEIMGSATVSEHFPTQDIS